MVFGEIQFRIIECLSPSVLVKIFISGKRTKSSLRPENMVVMRMRQINRIHSFLQRFKRNNKVFAKSAVNQHTVIYILPVEDVGY